MKTSQMIFAAALGAGALWAFQRYVDRKLSGTGQGSQPPRNDAKGPRLPAMPAMPDMPGLPPRSGAAPNEPRMEAGGSGWRELNQLVHPLPDIPPIGAMTRPQIRDTTGWFDRAGTRQNDAQTVFNAWTRMQ